MNAILVPALLAIVLQSQPATRPMPPMTAEEKTKAEAYVAVPTTQPHVKMVINPYRPDGSRHPAYGQPDPIFMRLHGEYKERSKQPAMVLFMGDSITEGWKYSGKKLWAERYGEFNAANFGISGSRTEHLLWRIAEGELDGFAAAPRQPPKVVVLLIGVNNGNKSPEDIAAGTGAVADAIHAKLPTSKILLLSIFPIRQSPENPDRAKMWKANQLLRKLDGSINGQVRYLEIWKPFLSEDGTLSKEIMPDFVHPTAKGYQIWADGMEGVLREMLK